MTVSRLICFTVTGALATSAACAQEFQRGDRNTALEPQNPSQFRAALKSSGITLEQEVIAEGLEHPWGIEVLPEGGYLVTERPGRLRHVATDGTLSDPISGVPEVVAQDQGPRFRRKPPGLSELCQAGG